ncbi:MAG: flagellar biosynthesis protein FlhA, partial [Pseudomonadota bacterium]|nr:flagellar biosynthesis protein FlhA [Pseudomonadota bacterium]
AEETQRKRALERKPESAVALLGVDHLAIDVGEALLPLLDEPAGSALLGRISDLRRSLALDLGLVIPAVRVRDDMRLPPRGFAIRVRDRVVAQAQLHADRALAIGPPGALAGLTGEAATDPVSGASALWLAPQSDSSGGEVQLAGRGTIVVDPIAVLTSKLGAVARAHAPALLGRQEVQVLLDHVRRTHPAAIKGVVPELVGLGLLQRVLQHLVREGVSIRDIVAILETIADEAEWTKDPSVIGEAARRRLAPAICASLSDENGAIRATALDNGLEGMLAGAITPTDRGPMLGLDIDAAQGLAQKLQGLALAAGAGRAVIVCTQSLRLPLARFAESCDASIAVVGLAEIVPGYMVAVQGTLSVA